MWKKLRDIPPDSATGRLLTLIETFGDGEMTRADFVREWQVERERAAADGDRVQDRLAALLDDLAFEIEPYRENPPTPEPDDPSGDELWNEVDQARIRYTGW